MAAVLATGEGAVLSHRSAAELWRMLRAENEDAPIVHVTIPGEGRHQPGIRVHRSATLLPEDSILWLGIPVTKPARTLEDLRGTFPGQVFAAALREAKFLQLPIGNGTAPDHTRSELEARFLTLLHRHRLPPPEVNIRVGGFVVDALWRAERLVAELDGREAHGTRSAFEADRSRDNRLRVLGFAVVRFTWRQVNDDPSGVAATVRSLLSADW